MKRLITLLAIAAMSSALQAEDGKLAVAGLNFAYPANWTSVPPTSPMRAGTLQIAVEGAEKPVEAVFYYFGAGQGGDSKANVDRWLGQFASPPESKTEDLDVNGTKVTLVTAHGTPPSSTKQAMRQRSSVSSRISLVKRTNIQRLYLRRAAKK